VFFASPGVDIILNNDRLPILNNATSVLDCSGVYSQGTNFNNSQGTNYNSDTGGGNGSGEGGLSVRDRQIQLVDRLVDGYE